jgi:hypothetical protein
MTDWLVVCSIWTMCAMCAFLFIRGASPQVRRAGAHPSREPAPLAQRDFSAH